MNVYLARQPIVNKRRKTVAYEMLYRCSLDNRYEADWDGTETTKKLIHNMMINFGFDYVTLGKRAFLNFTDTLLLSRTPFLLPPDRVAIELLEGIQFNEEIIERMRLLNHYGYMLALDDYVGQEIPEEAMELVRLIKVDWRGTSVETRKRIIEQYGQSKRLLAEKIETEKDFLDARDMGFDFFQGFYFAKPSLHFQKTYDVSIVTYIRLWQGISSSSVDFGKLAKIVEQDIGATYKLLCKANTLQYFHAHRVKSVQHALMIMGSDEVRRWVLLLLLNGLSEHKDEEIIHQALIRGVFAERISELINHEKLAHLAYLVGMFSVIDDDSKEMLHEIVESGPALKELREAFSGEHKILNDILNFTLAYEKNYMEEYITYIHDFLEEYNMNFELVAFQYLEAVCYAEQAFGIDPAEVTPEMAERLNLRF